MTDSRNLCCAGGYVLREFAGRSFRQKIILILLIAAGILGTAVDRVSARQLGQPAAGAQEPNAPAAFLRRLPIERSSHMQEEKKTARQQGMTSQAAACDYYLYADDYYENTADIWFVFSSYPSTVYFSIISGCGTITPKQVNPPILPPYEVYTTYTACEVEGSSVTIKADPLSGSNQYASICLDPRIDIKSGEQNESCVYTFDEYGNPVSAFVRVTVIPSGAGTAYPSSGWSEYDFWSGQYIFCSTYTAGSYDGRVRVKFRIDNPYPYDDSIVIISYDQTPPSCSPPTGVSASKGTYESKVRITWNPVGYPCSYYRVYRATSLTGSKTALGYWKISTSYNDYGAERGTTYYYWVKAAKNSSGSEASDYSEPDNGWSKLLPPSGVSATKGTHPDRVCITWNSVTGATHYRVYRATSLTGTKTALGYCQTSTSFCDYTAVPGTAYYYWVKSAKDSSCSGASGYSAYDIGWAGRSNDDCINAIAVVEGVPYYGSTVGATGTEQSSCGYYDTADVWHSYTSASTGLVTISLAGSAFNTTLAVFDSCGGMELACNDDLCDNLYSQIKMNMTEGNTYLIRIAGYNGATGDYTLTVTSIPCVEPNEPNSPVPINGANNVPVDTILSWNDWNGGSAEGFQAKGNKEEMSAKVIYGEDDRRDECDVNDPNILAAGDSTVVMLPSFELTYNGNGTFSLPPETLAWWYEQLDPIGTGNPLCPDEPFRDQPAPGWCSGFLVAPDIIATAGHCECSINCSEMAFVFGFIVPDCNEPNIAVLTVAESEVYYCSEVIISETGNPDWALIRLDREVTGHSPLSIRREGKVSNDQELIVIGYPFGLPRKYDDGATVRDNTPWAYFLANLDTYMGSSGGPVFNASSLEVEGILWGGQQDFAAGVVCDRSNVCLDTGCPGWEYVTRAAAFAPLVPWERYDVYLDVNNPPTELICSDVDVPMCEPNETLKPGTTYYWQVVAKNFCGETPGPNGPDDCWSFTTAPSDINVIVVIDEPCWMYQNLPDQNGCGLTADALINDDPMGNSSYSYEWEFILPSDVTVKPITIGPNDASCYTFAAPGCDEPNGISDSGQAFTVRVTVTGDDHGNTGTADANFGIGLLGDVNNDTIVDIDDRSIVNLFWRRGSAGSCSLRDCDVNCDDMIDVDDRSIVNLIMRDYLCQNSVSNPCPFRSPCP